MKHLLILLILLSGCGLRKSIQDKRAENKREWLRKKGYLTDQSDTIVRTDTIKGWSYDTLVVYDSTHLTDTLIVSNGNDSIVTIVKWKERTIRQIKTEKDTVRRDTLIRTTRTITKTAKVKSFNWTSFAWGAFVMALLVLILALRYFLKYGNINHK